MKTKKPSAIVYGWYKEGEEIITSDVYFEEGLEDDVINPLITKEILDDAFIECVIEDVEGMGHRIPITNFVHIYNKYIK